MKIRFLVGVLSAAALFGQANPQFSWVRAVDESAQSQFVGIGTDALGNTYIAGNTQAVDFPVRAAVQDQLASARGTNDVYVTKLDREGRIVYSTYFGGSGDDLASSLTVDAAGNAYVTGMTYSRDFPTTKGSYAPGPPVFAGASFLFRLNPDGSVGYSTFFTEATTKPQVVAVDEGGSAYLTGTTAGGLPVTPGAYQTECACGFTSAFFFSIPYYDGFLARFSPDGSRLEFATYLGLHRGVGNALAVGRDSSAYVATDLGVVRLDGMGRSRLAGAYPAVKPTRLALGDDGSVYVSGFADDRLHVSAGAAQRSPNLMPLLPYQSRQATQQAIVRMDADLKETLGATYFGGPYGQDIRSLAVRGGKLYLGGSTSPKGLPTVAPFVEAFGTPATGYAAVLKADLSKVLFSSYFGDRSFFSVSGVAVTADGTVVLGGSTNPKFLSPVPVGTVWVNGLRVDSPPAFRVDAVVNAASGLGGTVSGGETLAVRGSGFGADSQVLIDGAVVEKLSTSPGEILVVAPKSLVPGASVVQVRSGGLDSNAVLVPVGVTSPGLFSVDGTGTGQGYILNADGSRNAPENPARPGERFTIYATGVGPVSFDHGYAVTANPVSVFVEGLYAPGVAAVMGPVDGFAGDVYRLTVTVPDPKALAAGNPDLSTFGFPPQVGVVLQIAGVSSQNGLAISIKQ